MFSVHQGHVGHIYQYRQRTWLDKRLADPVLVQRTTTVWCELKKPLGNHRKGLVLITKEVYEYEILHKLLPVIWTHVDNPISTQSWDSPVLIHASVSNAHSVTTD